MKLGLSRAGPSAALCALLSACASASPSPDVERISFEPSPPPFCGRCETTRFTVGADGLLRGETGYWAGRYTDWRRQRFTRRVTPEQFAAFKQRLEPYRPDADRSVNQYACGAYIPDDAGVRIAWELGEERRTLHVDLGCADDRAMNDALVDAPRALGL
jgi:hypothetical protein